MSKISKPLSQRTHKKSIEKARETTSTSPEQIRRNKCQRSKARNAARKAERRAEAEARVAAYASRNANFKKKAAELRKGVSGIT